MSKHKATVQWNLSGGDFLKGQYSRVHTWSFDGGVVVQGSPAPSVVPPPSSDPTCVDPEEAFVAAIASCHMLTFLYLAGRAGFEVLSYRDEATGTLTKEPGRTPWVSAVALHPRIVYREGLAPAPEMEAQLHERAHKQCFIANSVKSAITVAGVEHVEI